jgi:hypothetical protein
MTVGYQVAHETFCILIDEPSESFCWKGTGVLVIWLIFYLTVNERFLLNHISVYVYTICKCELFQCHYAISGYHNNEF